VQAQSDGFKKIEGPVGGDTGFELMDYIAKFQLDNDPTSSVYQSLRVKLGYTDQLSNETYLGLTEADFAVTPYNRYAASANDNFQSEHEQYQATYVLDANKNWRGEITAYRNDFWRNWYKVQSVGGISSNDVLVDPTTYASEYGYLTGATSPDDAIQIRANNRSYTSQGVQAKIEWDLGFGDTDISLNVGVRIHEDEEDRFQHQDGYRMEDGTLVLTSAAASHSRRRGRPLPASGRLPHGRRHAGTDKRCSRWLTVKPCVGCQRKVLLCGYRDSRGRLDFHTGRAL